MIYKDEKLPGFKINELGQSFKFTTADIIEVPPKTRKYVVLEVHSPELEELRSKYGLSRLLKGHQFHITLAKKNFY